MKWKHVAKQFVQAFRSKPPGIKKDIHAQLEETIAERKRILQQWEKLFQPKYPALQKDIHTQLEETIAEHRKTKKQWERFFSPERNSRLIMRDKKAA